MGQPCFGPKYSNLSAYVVCPFKYSINAWFSLHHWFLWLGLSLSLGLKVRHAKYQNIRFFNWILQWINSLFRNIISLLHFSEHIQLSILYMLDKRHHDTDFEETIRNWVIMIAGKHAGSLISVLLIGFYFSLRGVQPLSAAVSDGPECWMGYMLLTTRTQDHLRHGFTLAQRWAAIGGR